MMLANIGHDRVKAVDARKAIPPLKVWPTDKPPDAHTAPPAPPPPAKKKVSKSYRHYGRSKSLAAPTSLLPTAYRRPVDWRWQRAQIEVDRGQKVFGAESDPHLAEAAAFLKHLWKGCRSDQDLIALAEGGEPVRSIWAALDLFLQEEPLKWELEARLLTHEGFSEIGRRLGMAATVVEWYHALFFDVRERLDVASYVIHVAIGRKIQALEPSDTATYWKWAAYQGGPKVLDALVYQRSQDFLNPEVSQFFREDAMAQLQLKAALAIRTLPLDDPKVALRVAALTIQLQRLEAHNRRPLPKRFGPAMDIGPNLKVFFEGLEKSFSGWMDPRLEAVFERERAKKAAESEPGVDLADL